MLSVDVPKKSKQEMLERYLKQRYRLDSWMGCLSVPAIKERSVQIAQELHELEKQMHIPHEKLDQWYSEWRPTEAGQRAILDVIHKRCGSCKYYYMNIPKQRKLAKWATQMCLEDSGLPKEIIPLLRARAKPCPQGIWDVFVVNQKKDEYELVVGTRFIGPEICPDFRKVEAKIRKVKSNG